MGKYSFHSNVLVKRGFTLIELVIVIGILAILAATVVLVLNPAQLLAQARDSQRLSDLGSIKGAIALYLASSATTTAVVAGPYCTATGCSTNGPFGGESISTSTVVTGGGWVPINLGDTVGGSPLAALPLDPTNSGYYFYAYKGDSTNKTFELDCRLESTRYAPIMTSDGGNRNYCPTYTDALCYYEIGTAAGLAL